MKPAQTLILILPVLFLSCSRDGVSSTDQAFLDIASRYVNDMFRIHPERATSLGEHSRDAMLDDHGPSARKAALALYRSYLDTLLEFPVKELATEQRIDYTILMHNIRRQIFELEELREWEWNPLYYNVSGSFYDLMARDFAPLPRRMESMTARLRALPRMLAQARKNLHNPSLLHTTVALRQNDGTIALLGETFQQFIDSLDAPSRRQIEGARDTAVAALQSYGRWLRSELLPTANRDFRLGAALFRKKLAFTLDTEIPAEEIVAAAEQGMLETEDALFRTAWPMYLNTGQDDHPDTADARVRRRIVQTMLDSVAAHHPDDESILATVRQDLEEAAAFLRKTDLVGMTGNEVEVIVMPEFQRGVAVAYCDAPGYFEKNGKTFFAVAPTPKRWNDERRASFYREYNYAMLKNMTVHEALPGHYLQQAHANAAGHGSVIRGMYRSAVFAEGWATYAEEFMAAYGYGGPEVRMQQLKMRLRLLLNAMLDYRVHVNGLTEREGVHLLVERGYQEEGEALAKWMRACVTSTQLTTYFFGNMEMRRLRKRFEHDAGGKFRLREFHDQVLLFGSVAPRYIAELLRLPAETPLAVAWGLHQ